MIINGVGLLEAAPIKDMLTEKRREHGVSHGLAEAGYDIRIKQQIEFLTDYPDGPFVTSQWEEGQDTIGTYEQGRFILASAIEEFQMPDNLVGLVKDKSTWARKGLSVFNTVIEPGWNGFLTMELVYHGNDYLCIPAGAGIAQVIFQTTATQASYSGKYQDQANRPVNAIYEKG